MSAEELEALLAPLREQWRREAYAADTCLCGAYYEGECGCGNYVDARSYVARQEILYLRAMVSNQ